MNDSQSCLLIATCALCKDRVRRVYKQHQGDNVFYQFTSCVSYSQLNIIVTKKGKDCHSRIHNSPSGYTGRDLREASKVERACSLQKRTIKLPEVRKFLNNDVVLVSAGSSYLLN